MKNKSKIIALFFAIIVLSNSFCFATEMPLNSTNDLEPTTSDEKSEALISTEETSLENSDEEKICKNDLYIFEDTVNMDKIVDGNVYIIGKDVNITGQINGNLFVIAENLTIGDDSSPSSNNGYIFSTIYALAQKATFKSSCYDLYTCGNNITLDSSFYSYRDVKIGSSTANIFGIVGRNIDVKTGILNLKKDDSTMARIMGNLNYSSSQELDKEISETCVNGTVNYSAVVKKGDSHLEQLPSIQSHVNNLIGKLLFTIFVWLIIVWLAPKFTKKASTLISKKPLQSLGTGLLWLVVTPIAFFVLLIPIITIPISLIGMILYALALSIAFSITCISITYLLKDTLKLDKWYKVLGGLVVTRVALYLLGLIPAIGGLISFLALILGLGILVYSFKKAYIISKKEISKNSEKTITEVTSEDETNKEE